MSRRTDCDSGTSAAPNTPCNMRATTISVSVAEIPHSTDASVKPATDTRNTFFRPKRSTSQPFSGVAMAAATMNDVSTHVIWSCDADSDPCMCGRATLAMVPSSAWMIVASMIEIVIMVRLMGAAAVTGRPRGAS
jgi:hypothetical protein